MTNIRRAGPGPCALLLIAAGCGAPPTSDAGIDASGGDDATTHADAVADSVTDAQLTADVSDGATDATDATDASDAPDATSAEDSGIVLDGGGELPDPSTCMITLLSDVSLYTDYRNAVVAAQRDAPSGARTTRAVLHTAAPPPALTSGGAMRQCLLLPPNNLPWFTGPMADRGTITVSQGSNTDSLRFDASGTTYPPVMGGAPFTAGTMVELTTGTPPVVALPFPPPIHLADLAPASLAFGHGVDTVVTYPATPLGARIEFRLTVVDEANHFTVVCAVPANSGSLTVPATMFSAFHPGDHVSWQAALVRAAQVRVGMDCTPYRLEALSEPASLTY